MPPRVLALIVNWNGAEVLEKTVRSLKESDYPQLQITVVDNASADASADEVQSRYPEVRVLRLAENRGFAGGHNAGLALALAEGFDYALLLNNDVLLEREALTRLVDCAEVGPRAAVLAPALRCADSPALLDSAWGQILYHHVIVRTLGVRQQPAGRYRKERAVDCVFGAVLLLRCRTLPETGLLDERFWMFLEEVEFCRRVRRFGYQVRYCPAARAYHLGGHSIRRAGADRLKLYLVRRNSVLFLRRHGRPWHWAFFLLCVALSLGASLLACAAGGRLPFWQARWEGYRDGFLGRLLPPDLLFGKYAARKADP